MASKNLSFKLVMDADTKNYVSNIKQSEAATKSVLATIKAEAEKLKGSAGGATQNLDALATQASETAARVAQLDQELAKTNTELAQTQSMAQRASTEVQGLKNGFSTLSGALGALGIGVTAAELAQTADAFKSLEARVALSVGQAGDFEGAMQGVNDIAIETRANLVATGELFSRVNTSVKELGYSQEQALAITKTINQAMIIGGGSAASNEAAITQLNQALQSGVLRGEEFNSIMEQSPRLARALAEGLGVPIGKLREMAEAGKLTTDRVLKAIQGQAGLIEKEFATMPVTIGQSIENLKTSWMTYLGELDKTHNVSARVAEALKMVAENLDGIFSTLTLATQAFIAYKALNIASVFLDKAAGAKAASVAIAQETVAITTNTQAQLANAAATKATTAAKGQMAAASGAAATSAATTGASVGALVGRLGALGIAITAVGVLIPTVFEPIGTYIGEGLAKSVEKAQIAFDNLGRSAADKKYLTAIEEMEVNLQAEAAAAKAAAESKQQIAAAAEKARDKTYQFTAESKKLVVEFDEIVKKGTSAKEAIEKVADAMKFDSTKGINDSVTALIALEKQGKITSEQLSTTLGKAMASQDLVVFQANAKAAFEGTSFEAQKMALVIEQAMTLAVERTGFSFEQLQGRGSAASRALINDVQVIISNLDALKEQGVDTGIALNASLSKAIAGAETEQQLNVIRGQISSLKTELGETVAGGLLDQIERQSFNITQQLDELRSGINSVNEAFSVFGLRSKDEAKLLASEYKAAYDVLVKSGQATTDQLQQAFKKYADVAVQANGGLVDGFTQAQASALGLKLEVDDTGKTSVDNMDKLEQSMHRVRNSTRDAEHGFRELGRTAREEAMSSTEAWNNAMAEMSGSMHQTRKGERDRMAFDEDMIVNELKAQGYSDKQAKELAREIYGGSLATGGKSYKQMGNQWGFVGGGGGMSNGDYVLQQLERFAQYAPAPSMESPTMTEISSQPGKTVKYQFVDPSGQIAEFDGSSQSGNVLEQMLSQLEMLKKAR